MNATIELIENARDFSLGLSVEVIDFLSGYTVWGMLEGFTPGEVTVSLPEMVTEQRAVSVRVNSFLFSGETLYCGAKEGGYEAHITIDDAKQNGLRRAPRFPVRFPAQMFPPHGAPLEITIVDISADGLGIEMPVGVEAGQPIAIANESVFVFAIVRHCRLINDGVFRAGVEMQHLFEKAAETPGVESRAGFLGKVFGKHSAVKRTGA